ncbi:MAG: nucleoside recognition domain-containing protein [Eubacteriales bacterium]|nr:nucleoside recognition domain-containing protein [Eubacteriales bacterium]
MLSKIWVGMLVSAVVYGLITGRADALTAAVTDGARQAVRLCGTLLGMMCFFSGLLELLRRSGLADALARLGRPVLRRLYPEADDAAMQSIAANVTANLLGMSNAATPSGLDAAQRLRTGDTASDSLCMLAVMGAVSFSLLPATAAALRASLGAAQPYAILPAVWFCSAAGLAAGVGSSFLYRRVT